VACGINLSNAAHASPTGRWKHRVSPSGMRAGLAGGLLVGVGSIFTLVIGARK